MRAIDDHHLERVLGGVLINNGLRGLIKAIKTGEGLKEYLEGMNPEGLRHMQQVIDQRGWLEGKSIGSYVDALKK